MKMKIMAVGVYLLGFATLASLFGLGWMYRAVRDYEHRNGVRVFGDRGKSAGWDLSAKETGDKGQTAGGRAKTGNASPEATVEGAELHVLGVHYDGDDELRVMMSRMPDMSVADKYVSVEPMSSGSLRLSSRKLWFYEGDEDVPCLVVNGEFAFQTNLTLRIRQGLPEEAGKADCVLKEDYTHVFRRDNISPNVSFVAHGRYLPPGGSRTIGVKSINNSNMVVRTWRVMPGNLVQLMAREEERYSGYYNSGEDSSDADELSDGMSEMEIACRNQVNVGEEVQVPVGVDDGGPQNGVYLVSVTGGGVAERERRWRRKHRLVCVSDLGLAVRQSASGVGVWVTSLTNGRPVAGAKVEVRNAAGVLLRDGETGPDGWCATREVKTGEPFAVIVRTASGDDMTFLAMARRMMVDETPADGVREGYLRAAECTGFAWTEREIYRHGEKMFLHLLLRNGEMRAPKPFPVLLELVSPGGKTFATHTAMPDDSGALHYEGFSVPGGQPGGKWTIRAKTPGGRQTLTSAVVKVEEFAPPQVRVTVRTDEATAATNFAFGVAAEYMFGGAAGGLVCEGAVVFEDAAFAPAGWEGYRFGNPDLGLQPNFQRLERRRLDGIGRAEFAAPMGDDLGNPRAMVRAIGQGVVFEDGGRPATARAEAMLHHYPYYIGSRLPDLVRRPADGVISVDIACVRPDGAREEGGRRLRMRLERIDSVFSYRREENGYSTWDCERVRVTITDGTEVVTADGRDTTITLPPIKGGDYALTISDPETGTSFGKIFYCSECGDDSVRAPLSNPVKVAIASDKTEYRVGDVPRLVVKAPFAGHAMLSVMRERELYTEILELTNATSVVALKPIAREDAPNLNVYLSVVQSVDASAKHLAARAHGQCSLRVRPVEYEVPVKVTTRMEGLRKVIVEVEAPGADNAVVTLVDEGINLLTGNHVPDPIAAFARLRGAENPLFDIYGLVLPVNGDAVRANGVKSGGGMGAELLGRVSPVGSRRFKPLAMWQPAVELTDGRGRAEFALPEFAGEVRVTAVAYSQKATGAASVLQKIAPKLVMLPDAPRFVAPGDMFGVTMPVINRSGAAGVVTAEVQGTRFALPLAAGEATNLTVLLEAPAEPGQMALRYAAKGLGEAHECTIDLPVRPAVAWRETAGVCREAEWRQPEGGEWSARTFDSPLAEYEAALRWLAEYRHGCLEQTCSRMFPLVAAGGILNGIVTNAPGKVAGGVARVSSMVRQSDFVIWPDCGYEPWDREVSVYAAHFLFAARKAGVKMPEDMESRVQGFVSRWMMRQPDDLAAYACLVAAIGEFPNRSRMFSLYDRRQQLSPLARARLACAFAEIADLRRARELLADAHEPQSVKEAAFQLMARTAVNPKEEKLLPLVAWLNARRDRARYSWGTTGENAHALMAIGAYYQANPPKRGERYVAWRKLTLPKPEEVTAEAVGIAVERRFLAADGKPVDGLELRRGELLTVELTLTSDVEREVNDLVIEDLFAGAFEPVRNPLGIAQEEWVMRKEAHDDRMLVYSKRFKLAADKPMVFRYQVRVVSAGEYVLPGTSVEAMYDPSMHATCPSRRIVVK